MLVDDLKVDPKKGLSEKEAQNRLEQYGLNSLEEKKEPLWKKFTSHLWGPIPWMIEIAAILSALLGNWPDFIIIVALLLINSCIGFFQSSKADQAIDELKKSLALKANVLRDGAWKEIDASKLVPGDIVTVKLGNIVPADIVLISEGFLSIDQSSLTGESLPVTKKQNDTAFSSTIVKMGQMIGVVQFTGRETQIGKTTHLVAQAKEHGAYQKIVMQIGNFLILTTLAICTILMVVDLYQLEETHQIHHKIGELLIFILVLVVAGIPIALPSVLSVTMAVGASHLAKMKAIVSKLTSLESLASMNMLCSDKTGTLTQNKLTVGESWIGDGFSEENLFLYAALAASQADRDAIDEAVVLKLPDPKVLEQYQISDFVPFDPVGKKTEAKVSDGKKTFYVTKGAVQVIEALCANAQKEQIEAKIESFAKEGFRTIAVATSEDHKTWRFVGLISLFDPPRKDTSATIEHLQELGVSIKMLTGDHTSIAVSLAKTLKMGTNILPFREKKEVSEHDIQTADGFAQIYPEDKFKIVESLQHAKYTVGMTGDGVNDAPALKEAHVGIAVSDATDAARAAADIVLTEDGLGVIGNAIIKAREVFERMKSYTLYRITETLRILLFLFLAMLIFKEHPLTAIMIILIALLNDIPIMSIAYDNAQAPQEPCRWHMKEIFIVSIALSIIGVLSTFILLWIGLRHWELDLIQSRTLAFFGILCGGNLTIFITRNDRYFFSKPYPRSYFLLATVIPLIVGTLMSVYGLGTPNFVGIGWSVILQSWCYILIWFLIMAFFKQWICKYTRLD